MEAFEGDDSFVSENGQYDLTLIVDKHKIHVLKAVLCIASPVFRDMLGLDFKAQERNEIQLPGKNYNDVVNFLKCIYPDRMENVTSDTVYGVLPLAHEYQVNALLKKCQEFLLQLVKSKHLTDVMEICRHIQISEKYNLGDLNQKSVSMASEFSLEDFEKASKKYHITDDSLIKVHRLARMRDELTKDDDSSVFLSQGLFINGTFDSQIKEYIERQTYYRRAESILQALRLCYRHCRNDLQLFEDAITAYKGFKETKSDTMDGIEINGEKVVSLLPEMVKQKLDLK